jgi:hypothetical protein
MPHIDDGPTNGPQGAALQTVTVTLAAAEGRELLEALSEWAGKDRRGAT